MERIDGTLLLGNLLARLLQAFWHLGDGILRQSWRSPVLKLSSSRLEGQIIYFEVSYRAISFFRTHGHLAYFSYGRNQSPSRPIGRVQGLLPATEVGRERYKRVISCQLRTHQWIRCSANTTI